MAAIINEHHPSMTTSSLGENAKLELSQKIEGQLGGRITGICIFSQDDGLLTINEDKSLRVLLKRESGQYWPSIVQDLPNIPTKLYYENSNNLIFVGFVNGLVYEYSIENDLNSISFKRQWPSHTSTVSGLGYSRKHSYIVSCSKDKTIVWHCTTTTKKIGSYCASSPCTAMEFDEDSSFIFIGDYSNNVYVLRLIEGTFQPQLISKLSAHTGSITDLAWDSGNQLLYSASADSLIIVWDIGGRRGNCYELNGHNSKLTKLALGKQSFRRLFSADESGRLMCWDMETKRITAPAWRDSDKCEICDQPFFWNLKDMWDRKIVGVRRHHCRTCGQSVCSVCCNNFTIFPAMGFEKPIRICKTCHGKMQNFPDQFNLTPLAVTNDLRQGIIEMAFDEQKQRLITVGYDRVVMIWNVRNLL